jgi:voltage-gated potassium channel Kch
MFFSFIYGVIGAVEPDALFAELHDSNREDQLYFSFVTLTTVGYGDLTPAGGITRAFAVAEMLIGQIYLVTIVSLIVTNLGAARRRA